MPPRAAPRLMKMWESLSGRRLVFTQGREIAAGDSGSHFSAPFSKEFFMPHCNGTFDENYSPLAKGAARSARGLSVRPSQTHQDNPLKASPSFPLY